MHIFIFWVSIAGTRPKFHFTPRYGWTNDPNGLNFAPDANGKIMSHLFYQANPNSTHNPWSPPWAPAYWGHATSPDLVTWTEVQPSAIRGGSGAILPLPTKMLRSAKGVTAIAFGGAYSGIDFWTSRDPSQLWWDPPIGCTDAGPPSGKVTCNASSMTRTRPGRWMVPTSIQAGSSLGDPTAAWVNHTDGKLYGVFASSEQCSNCTWRDPGKYQALLFRTKTDSDYTEWEFVSLFWRAPPTQTSPTMGFTNCPDAFRLPDGRWVFAYLSHATQYGGQRILSFVGTCDAEWSCEWPESGQGQYDYSHAFIASQSFTSPDGRRVLFGWISGPNGADYVGGQSIPRVITASAGGPLRVVPLPELTSLHLNHNAFDATSNSSLVPHTTNSYHLNITFAIDALDNHSLVPARAAELSLQLFTDADGQGVKGPSLSPPWSTRAQTPLLRTSLTGKILDTYNTTDSTACARLCANHQPPGTCGGWTWQDSSVCTVRGTGARVLADVGSGCDALGHPGCTSGLMGWQLHVPGVTTPITLLPTSQRTLTLELFVDQQVCEVFAHDKRGRGAVVSTFACSAPHSDATGVSVVVVGAEGVRVRGALSDMDGCILPPPRR